MHETLNEDLKARTEANKQQTNRIQDLEAKNAETIKKYEEMRQHFYKAKEELKKIKAETSKEN